MAELDEPQVRKRITTLRKRFEGQNGLHERVRWRRQHFHQDPAVDPPMPKGFEDFAKQWGDLRKVHLKLKARLLENEWLPQFTSAKSTSAGKLLAEQAESLFVQGFSQFQKSTGISLQSDLADELSVAGVGALHWELDMSQWSALDYEETDSNETDPERYTEDEYDEEATAGRKKTKKYRETEAALQDRIARARAAKGFPVWAEVLPIEMCAWTQDRSQVSEFSEFLVMREIAEPPDWVKPDTEPEERDSPITQRQGTKDMSNPSAVDWDGTYTVYQYWNRTHFYEVCERKDKQEQAYFRCEAHPYKMPPFALCAGAMVHHNDPVYRFEPALQSLYRIKPDYDRAMSLFMILSEAGAVPLYIMVNKSNGQPRRLTEDGDIALFSESSAAAMELPEGYELQRFGGDGVSGDFVKGLEFMKVLWQEGAPDSGFAQFGASTQPWSARIEQSQNNMEPKMYLKHMAQTLLAMCSNLVDVFSDESTGVGTVYGWATGAGRGYDTSKTVSVDPKGWAGLTVDVSINEIGSAEQITVAQYLITLVHDDKIAMTPEEFQEQAMNDPHPVETMIDRYVDAYILQNVMPNMLKEAAAEQMADKYFLGPNAQILDANGQVVAPQQYLQQTGQMPQGPQPPQQGMQAPPQQGQMPSMPGIAAPGTMPLQGVAG